MLKELLSEEKTEESISLDPSEFYTATRNYNICTFIVRGRLRSGEEKSMRNTSTNTEIDEQQITEVNIS